MRTINAPDSLILSSFILNKKESLKELLVQLNIGE